LQVERGVWEAVEAPTMLQVVDRQIAITELHNAAIPVGAVDGVKEAHRHAQVQPAPDLEYPTRFVAQSAYRVIEPIQIQGASLRERGDQIRQLLGIHHRPSVRLR
jgi:hypothetical protein